MSRELAHAGHVTERPSPVPAMASANLEAARKALSAARARVARESTVEAERDLTKMHNEAV